MHYKKILLLIPFFVSLPIKAGDDFGLWTEIGIQKEVVKNLSVDAALEFRAEDNVRQASRWTTSVGIGYKPFKNLSVGAGYVFIHDYSPQETKTDYKEDDDGNILTDEEGLPQLNGYNLDHGFWRNKHRATFDITGKISLGRFTFSLRERYQFTHYVATSTKRTRYRSLIPSSMIENGGYSGDYVLFEDQYWGTTKVVDDEKQAKNRHYLRSRLQIEYNIRHCSWTPYISCELSNNLCDAFYLDKTRYTIGAEWKITKKHRMEFAYLYEDGADDDALNNNHAISISYKFKF